MRIQERDGWLWRAEVDVPNDAPESEVRPLLAQFIDSFLGPPPLRVPRGTPPPLTVVSTCL